MRCSSSQRTQHQRHSVTFLGVNMQDNIKYSPLENEHRYILVSADGKFAEEFPTHRAAKRFAKKHQILGWVAKVIGIFEESEDTLRGRGRIERRRGNRGRA